MDFRLTERQEELKKTFEAFFEESMKDAPPIFLSNPAGAIFDDDEGWAFHRQMQKRLGEKGWLSLAWPKEYGGSEASIIDQVVFNEAREKIGCPGVDPMGLGMFAPTLLVAGSEEQKKRLLPPIARGDVHYCQGWSEPDAGSDLANLTTVAIKDGDEYIVNGQKTWTTAAHRADSMFLLARTDPDSRRSKGLSMFHIKMDLPGIEVRPIYLMNGSHDFNDVFFKDVRIRAEDLIGGEGNGWSVTMNTMNFERSGMGFFSMGMRMLEKIIEYAKTHKRGGKTLSENPIIRQKIAKMHTRFQSGMAMALRVACMQEEGGLALAAAVASGSKILGTELMKQVYTLGTEVAGLYGKIDDSSWAPLGGLTASFQHAPGPAIAGGSNEIQRSIIAWMGLGLPRYKLQK